VFYSNNKTASAGLSAVKTISRIELQGKKRKPQLQSKRKKKLLLIFSSTLPITFFYKRYLLVLWRKMLERHVKQIIKITEETIWWVILGDTLVKTY
jgi:hypothetical protein